MYDSIKPVLLTGDLEGNFLASFALGWAVTTGAGIASYPLDTIRRRMMMTSGEAVKYNGTMDAGRQIIAAEGVRSLFKGAGANILRGVAGAGVLSICKFARYSCFLDPSANTLSRRPGSTSHVRQEVQRWLWLSREILLFKKENKRVGWVNVYEKGERQIWGCDGGLYVSHATNGYWGEAEEEGEEGWVCFLLHLDEGTYEHNVLRLGSQWECILLSVILL
jgi:hypothetical protein